MRDDDEQKLDPETLSAYERLEQIMRQPMQLSATDEQCLQAEADLAAIQAEADLPDLQGNVFRQEWIDAAIKKGQQMADCQDPDCQRQHLVIIDEAAMFTEKDLEKAQAYFQRPDWPIRPRVQGTAAPTPQVLPPVRLSHVEMTPEKWTHVREALQQPPRNYAAWLGLEKQTTSGRLIPPVSEGVLRDIWRRYFGDKDQQPDADGFYHVGPPASSAEEQEPEQWWQEAMHYMQQRIVTILSIPEDYLTDIHRSDLDALAEELREKIEDHYE